MISKFRLWTFLVISVLLCCAISWTLWEISTHNGPKYFLQFDTDVHTMAFSSDGQFIDVTSQGERCKITIWDTRDGDFLESIPACPDTVNQVSICAISYSSNGNYLATKACGYKTAWIFDLTNDGKIVQELQGLPKVVGISLNHAGDRVLTSNGQLWDIATGDEIWRLVGHEAGIFKAKFSADERLIATASFDGTAAIWDATDGRELMQFVGHADVVNDVEFGPNGETLFTASADGTVRQWNVASGTEISRFDLPEKQLRNVFYVPTQENIIVVGEYSDVWIFDVRTQKQEAHFKPGPAAWLTTAGMSPDKSILALAHGHEVTVWDIHK